MDKVRVAINGFGRIGRMVFRAIHEREGIEVVAINGLMDGATAAYLTRYDSTQGRFPGQVEFDGKDLVVDGRRVFLSQEADPRKINWGDTQPEVVVESSGVFRRKSAPDGGYGDHLRGSVKKVVLTDPAKDSIDRMVVLGVNDEVIRHSQNAPLPSPPRATAPPFWTVPLNNPSTNHSLPEPDDREQ